MRVTPAWPALIEQVWMEGQPGQVTAEPGVMLLAVLCSCVGIKLFTVQGVLPRRETHMDDELTCSTAAKKKVVEEACIWRGGRQNRSRPSSQLKD